MALLMPRPANALNNEMENFMSSSGDAGVIIVSFGNNGVSTGTRSDEHVSRHVCTVEAEDFVENKR